MANYLTQADVENYGSELLDVAARTAMQTIAPHLQQLQAENADMRARLAKESRRNLDQQVAVAVPNYREIDRNPDWHRWLMGIDLMSGRVRQQLLNEAIASGDATRVKSIFNGFERQAGQSTSSRTPRGRSAAPNQNFYTHADIKRLYDQHQKGAFAGREDEWARLEADIFAAQREGRVERKVYLTK